ncbi:MAG: maleylpyruvate isomerase family mycothiol-dependent enzyme [Actinomycetota bacterium]
MTELVVACLDETWSSIEALCSGFTAQDWARPTDLPGWSVQDQLAHLCGIEARLLGRPQPKPLADPPPHVRNPLGAMNEAQIEIRRSWAPEEVLAEFMELTAERLSVVAAMNERAMAAESDGVLGRAPMRDVLAIREVDCFYHEQDMRRATGARGSLDGVPAAFVFERMQRALPMIVGKRAAAPDGTVLVWDVTGPAGATTTVTVSGGRGAIGEHVPGAETATIRTDLETFLCLTGGRWTRQRAGDRVVVEGDEALAVAVLDNCNIMI